MSRPGADGGQGSGGGQGADGERGEPGEPGEDPQQGARGALGARPRRWTYRLLIGLGALLIVGVVAWQLTATLWTTHSERVGKALVHQFLKDRAAASPVKTAPGGASQAVTASLVSCGIATDPKGAQGLLIIPRLGVTAPVEQGTGDAQLAVAVGHDPYSVWPGTPGNAVLEAHDVSYFQNLPQLQAGNSVIYETPCTTYVFQVQGHSIVSQGTTVYNTPGPTITLVTCWPTNALWFTPDRYLVTATETNSSATSQSNLTYLTAQAAPSVPAPAALASQGLTLATNSIPMGTMALAGKPDAVWSQTTNPLLIQGSGVSGFIAGVKSLTENQLGWWRAIAPGVAIPAPLAGAHTPGYLTPLDVTVSATGYAPNGVRLSTTMSVSGGKAPGRYSVSVTETITGHTLLISSWTMTPA